MCFPVKREARLGNGLKRDAGRQGRKGREQGKWGCVQWRDGIGCQMKQAECQHKEECV